MHVLAPLARLPGRLMIHLRDLPSIPVIYFVLQPGPTLLYIGQTRDLADRWKRGGAAHHRSAQLTAPDHWLCWYAVDAGISKTKLDVLERMLIKRYQPILNDTRLERRAVVDARPFIERQRQRHAHLGETLHACAEVQAQIVATEDAMDRQMAAAIRWLRAYRNGLERVRDKRQRQQEQLTNTLATIRAGCNRFLPSIRNVDKRSA